MIFVEPNSYFSSYVNFTLSSTDIDVLNLLYLPIVGKDAILIYNLFFTYGNNKNNSFIFNHEDFCIDKKISESDFLNSRNKLEGIGLLETYRKEETKDNNKIINYVYKLNPPATANKFLNDPILSSLLSSNISNKELVNLKLFFKESNNRFNDCENVSTKLNEIFVIKKETNKDKETFIEKKYKKTFNTNLANIEKKLLSLDINVSSLSKYEKLIEKYLALYQISDDKAVDIIASCISTDNKFNDKIFIEKCKNATIFSIDKETTLVDLNKYNSKVDTDKYLISTKEFLTKLIHAEPPQYILSSIEEKAIKYNFTPDIINLILDYSISNKKGQLNIYDIENLCIYLSYNQTSDLFTAIQYLKRKEYENDNQNINSKKISKSKNVEIDNVKEDKPQKDIKKIDIKKLGLDV